MSRIGIWMLKRMARSTELVEESTRCSPEESLGLALELFPNFVERIRDGRVLDFGCGHGNQVRAMACHAAEVVGLDTNRDALADAEALTEGHRYRTRIRYVDSVEDLESGFNIVYSQNAMEHYPQPVKVLRTMRRLLAPGGRIVLHFCPPWLAPYGSHTRFFTPVPWVHLLFPERSVMEVRSQYRNDGAERYVEVEGGLNKMTLRKFEDCVEEAELRMEQRNLVAVKGLPLVTRIPLLREFLTNRVACVLIPR